MAEQDALIARAAFPNVFTFIVHLSGMSRAEMKVQLAELAAQARECGWTVKDGKAYLPPGRREAFAAAIGLTRDGEESEEQ